MAVLEIMVTGFAVVFGVLILLWGVTTQSSVILSGIEKVGRMMSPKGKIPAHHMVAIAAAAEAVIEPRGRAVRVLVRPHNVPAWASEGRYRNFTPASSNFARSASVGPTNRTGNG